MKPIFLDLSKSSFTYVIILENILCILTIVPDLYEPKHKHVDKTTLVVGINHLQNSVCDANIYKSSEEG